MAKKNTRAKKSFPKTALPVFKSISTDTRSAIYSLPDDLLEHIAFELKAERKFASLAALDQSCKRFSGVCKAILWQDVSLKNSSYGARLFSKKLSPLRALIGYIYVDTEDNRWFWNALRAFSPKTQTRDAMVHTAFPNVKMLAERSLVWPDDHVTLGDDEEKIPEPADNIRIWISVRNNVSDAANTSQTMAKVIAAILEFSDLQYPTVSDYADDIVALPAFATRYDPAGDNVDREVFLEYTRRISAQSPLISRLPPQVAETTFAGLFDAYKAGTLSSYPSALKPHFDMIMNDIVKRTESDGCLLRMEGIGTVGVHTLFDKKSPNVHREVVSVTYKLFQQLNRLFSTEMNRECYGPMRCSVRCETFGQAEQWLQRLLESQDPDSLHQSRHPSSVMAIDLREDMSPNKLFTNAWNRIQQPFLKHLDRLPVMATTDLPQKLVITANYHEKLDGVPIVEMDFATAESRRMTVAGILDDEDEMISERFYRDGQLVKLSRED